MAAFTYADTLRPGFSLAMECLACLPPGPKHPVSVANLTADLGLPNQNQTQDLLQQLRTAGFQIRGTNNPKVGRVVYLDILGSRAAQAAAETYWRTVYEATPLVAAAVAIMLPETHPTATSDRRCA